MSSGPKYPLMTKAEVLALPEEEQKWAFRANPQLSSQHMDGKCDKCNRRFSWTGLKVHAYRFQCPYCNDGAILRATTEVEYRAYYALLRCQGEQREFCLIRPRRVVVESYHDGLPAYEVLP